MIWKKEFAVPAGHCAFAMDPENRVESVPEVGETLMLPSTAAEATPGASVARAAVPEIRQIAPAGRVHRWRVRSVGAGCVYIG